MDELNPADLAQILAVLRQFDVESFKHGSLEVHLRPIMPEVTPKTFNQALEDETVARPALTDPSQITFR